MLVSNSMSDVTVAISILHTVYSTDSIDSVSVIHLVTQTLYMTLVPGCIMEEPGTDPLTSPYLYLLKPCCLK